MWRWILLLVTTALGPGCVTLVHRDLPDPVSCDRVVFDQVHLNGFEVPYQQLQVWSTTGLVGLFGSGGGYASGSFASVTTKVEDRLSRALRHAGARYLEDIGLVGRADEDGQQIADLILEGRITTSGSWSNAWSVPVDLITAVTLVLPITWASEVQCSLRVYGPDGAFLKQYSSDAERVRSWYHWATDVRIRASNARYAQGGLLAMRDVLDAFARDALAGAFSSALDARSHDDPMRAQTDERKPTEGSAVDPLIRAALGEQ